MITVAALCGFAGLILGFSTNIRMFVLVVLVIVLGVFLAGFMGDGSLLRAIAWGFGGLFATQIGYILMVVARAAVSVQSAKSRQPIPY